MSPLLADASGRIFFGTLSRDATRCQTANNRANIFSTSCFSLLKTGLVEVVLAGSVSGEFTATASDNLCLIFCRLLSGKLSLLLIEGTICRDRRQT
jgi:hypothetical protein